MSSPPTWLTPFFLNSWRPCLLALTLAGLAISFATPALQAAPAAELLLQDQTDTAYEPAELILQFELGLSDAEINAFYSDYADRGITLIESLAKSPLHSGPMQHLVAVEEGEERSFAAELALDARVQFAELNYLVQHTLTPNDPDYSQLWGMHNTGQTGGTADADIDAPEAWDISTGSASVLVFGIDTGIDIDHPDLVANIWVNPGETAGNGIDDDGNGYIDDVHGINAINGTGNPDDDNNHGTHTHGTIGGVGNNSTGVVGVNWTVTMGHCKFLGATGGGTTANAIECFNYVNDLKVNRRQDVDVTNNSWGGGGFNAALQTSMDGPAGMPKILHAAAAGNSNNNNDLNPHYPSSYGLAHLIAVAATDHNDNYAGFSSYGATSVDIAAPGVNVRSTIRNGGYANFNGTSMATPHVAGCAALLLSIDSTLTAAELKQAILDQGDALAGQSKQTLSNDRLNCASSAKAVEPVGGTVDLAVTKVDSADPAIAGTTLSYTLTVSNNGPADVEGFTITDTLPAGAAFESATPSAGLVCGTVPVVGSQGGTLVCSYAGSLSTSITVPLTVDIRICPEMACAAQISNTAVVGLNDPSQTDSDTSNNTAVEATTVETQSSFTVTKTGDPSQASIGQNVTYTIVITNSGPSNAVTPVLTDILPPNFTYVDSRISGGTGSCSAAGTTVTCNLGTIGAPDQCATSFAEVVTVEIDTLVGSNEGTPLVTPGCLAGLVTNTATIASGNCLADLGSLRGEAETCTAPTAPVLGSIEYDVIMPIGQAEVARPLGDASGMAVQAGQEVLASTSATGSSIDKPAELDAMSELLGLDMGPPLAEIPVNIVTEADAPDPCQTARVLTEIRVTEAGVGDVRNLAGVPETVVTWHPHFEVESCEVIFPMGGTCSFSGNVSEFDYSMLQGETLVVRVLLRFIGGLGNSNIVGGDLCLNWDGLVNFFPDDMFVADDDQRCGPLQDVVIACTPSVDPNRQLGCQVHLPILDFQGQDDVCRSWIEVQYIGCEPSKAILITWGEPGFCPPQSAGPLKVECTGLLNAGSAWNLLGSQIPTGSKGGMLFKFSALQLGELPGNPGPTLADDLGFDDVMADLMCETLFFGVVGDSDDYRRFKKAYNEKLVFASIPMGTAMGSGILAAEVLRHCPGDVTPGVEVSSKYNGIAAAHLGYYDPVFGGYGYYVPLIYAEKAGLNTVIYIQNGALECSSVELWFKSQDDCLRARICDILALAPGETFQFDASDCVGPDWQGSAWIRTSEAMGIAVDIYGRDILMTYIGEPQPYDYVMEMDGEFVGEATPTTGEKVAFGPLIYSEYQGWDTGVQVMNLSPVYNAKVKVYFLDKSGDIITTLVDWICPRGSQTYFLPVIADLPGTWVGSLRVESQDWWAPGVKPVEAPDIVGVAMLMRYSDVARTETEEAIAYNLLPEHKSYTWQVGYGAGGRTSGVGLIAIPSLLKDLDGTGTTSELAIMNIVTKPGFTDFAIYIYDQNGLLDFVCQKIHREQVEYIDLQTWGYVSNGFKGSAIISATFWEHEVFDGEGNFIRNLLGLGAVSIERTGARLGEDIPGDEAAGSRGIPFARDHNLEACLGGFVPLCPGQPGFAMADGACGPLVAEGAIGPIVDNALSDFEAETQFIGSCEVRDVNIELDITHTFSADLDVSLVHAGTSSQLFTDVCGTDDDVLVTLDDDDPAGLGNIGNGLSCAGTGPVGGGQTFTTESGSGLDAFVGETASGVWRLQIVDDAAGDSGDLNAWSLSIETVSR